MLYYVYFNKDDPNDGEITEAPSAWSAAHKAAENWVEPNESTIAYVCELSKPERFRVQSRVELIVDDNPMFDEE